MSCFGGLMREYRYLSIDRFDGINLSSRAYFLSHCHTDHMVGLDANEFSCHLSSRSDIFLYCSEVTGSLLLADDRYSHLSKHVYTLPIDEPTILEIRDNEGDTSMVSVTLLPAAHCPGSVMFFFEGHEGNVLYTGDFRLRKGSAKRMKFLHTPCGAKKPMKSIYVDTTFCRPDAIFIPSREDCLKKLQSVISDWFAKSKMHSVRLNISAKYGYEYLFDALGKAFQTKIYCRNKSFYHCLPHIYNILTTDPQGARIYACFRKERIGKKKHRDVGDDETDVPAHENLLRLTLSTMYFLYEAKPHEICHQISKNHYRLCFSFHSSHSEVCDLIRYFQPENVYANVRPRNIESLGDVEKRLIKDCGLKSAEKPELQPSKVDKPKPVASTSLKPTNKPSRKRVISLSTDDDDSQNLLEQLVAKNKQKRNTEGDNEMEKRVKKSSSSALADDFNVSSSPESLNESEIDDLHVKIALNGGQPPMI